MSQKFTHHVQIVPAEHDIGLETLSSLRNEPVHQTRDVTVDALLLTSAGVGQQKFGSAATRVSVSDDGEMFCPPESLPLDPLAPGGRGLFLVSRLGAPIRVKRGFGRGKTVSVSLPTRPLAASYVA